MAIPDHTVFYPKNLTVGWDLLRSMAGPEKNGANPKLGCRGGMNKEDVSACVPTRGHTLVTRRTHCPSCELGPVESVDYYKTRCRHSGMRGMQTLGCAYGGSFSLACEDFGRIFDFSNLACTFFFLSFFSSFFLLLLLFLKWRLARAH